MQYVAIKILLARCQPLLITLIEQQANRLLEDWASGKLKDKEFLSGVSAPDTWRWAVRTADIVGMHTCTPETTRQLFAAAQAAQTQQGQMVTQYPPQTPGSGVGLSW